MSDGYARIEPVIAAGTRAVEKVRGDSEAADADSRQNTKLRDADRDHAHLARRRLLAWMIGRAVSRPLSAMTGAMRKLAEGDFDVVLPGLGRKDEIGDMAGAVETFKLKAVEKAEREAQEREAAAQAAASARKAEMCRLADSFEADRRRRGANGLGRLDAARGRRRAACAIPRNRRSSAPAWSRRRPSRLPPTSRPSRPRPRR